MFDNFPFIIEDEAPAEIPNDDTIDRAAQLLFNGKTVGWYQGHGEIGPRALGNRSIFCNPLLPNGKELINGIKNRESFRPFGAVVLREYAHQYFDIDGEDPYMLFMANVLDKRLLSITHIDNTCRLQTLNQENNILRLLLERFMNYSSCPILLNTSLNVSGRPIAGSISDAIELYTKSKLDVLVYGNVVLQK